MADAAPEAEAGQSGGTCFAMLLIIAACLLVRLPALGADPPAWLSWSRGLYTDEGFYSLDARHHALFGGWAPGDFHDRMVSPLLTAMQISAFSLVGATREAARSVSVICSLATLLLFRSALRMERGSRAAAAGLLFLGLVPIYALYNRLALQETPAAALLVASFWFASAAKDRSPERAAQICWFCSGALLACVVTVKSLGLIALPGLLAGSLAASRSEGRRRSGVAAMAGFICGIGLYAAVWWMPHHAELARMNRYYLTHQVVPHALSSVWLNARRFAVDTERGTLPFLVAAAPAPVWLCLKWFAGRRHGGIGKPSPAEIYAAVWLAAGLAAFALSSYAPSRYDVLILPPLCYLAAVRWSSSTPRGQWAAVALFLVSSGAWYGRYWTNMTHTEAAASKRMALMAAPGSLALGDMAPQICLGTGIKAAPWQYGLSNYVAPIETLHPDILVIGREPAWRGWWGRREPELVSPENYLGTIAIGTTSECITDLYRGHKENQAR